MIRLRPKVLLATCAMALFLAACGSTPAPKASVKQRFQHNLGEGFTLDYTIERAPSRDNPRACFAFITGTLHNNSPHLLSKKSVLDFIVTHRGQMLFRDITYPIADISPGGSAMFEMVDSPVHKEGCPEYERIDITLRKLYLN